MGVIRTSPALLVALLVAAPNRLSSTITMQVRMGCWVCGAESIDLGKRSSELAFMSSVAVEVSYRATLFRKLKWY
jgi:hypothetical protein